MNPPDEITRSRGHPPKAFVTESRRAWAFWLIPLGAAGLCAWFVFRDYVATGPLITIYFENTDGLEAKNTQLRFRGASIGQVKSLQLAGDNQHIEVKARLAGPARNLARAGALFWIVRPELNVGSVSGLGTIVSGEYITVRPGKGAPTNTFAGVEKEPPAERPGALQINLLAPALGSLQSGSPIFYRGIEAGEVMSFRLGENSSNVVIHARIWKEYAPLVRLESKFWNAGGLDFHVGLFKGLEISAESPKTIISGGIEFATPPEFGERAAEGTTFVLQPKADNKWREWTPAIRLQLPEATAETNPPSRLEDVLTRIK